MAESKIQWTDYTFNPWTGCAKISEGCKFCYAESNYSVKLRGIKWGPNGTRVKTSPGNWNEVRKWNRKAGEEGVRRRVFVGSLMDWAEDWQGTILNHKEKILNNEHKPAGNADMHNDDLLTMNDLRRALFDLIDECQNLDFLMLTKRADRIVDCWKPRRVEKMFTYHRPNVWIGTSVEDQKTANERLPELLKCRDLAPVLFVSYEPALGPVNFSEYAAYLNWVIIGGESGPKARKCNVRWIENAVNYLRFEVGISVFVKQLGAKPVTLVHPFGPCELELADKKGGDIEEWPEDLRIREFPAANETARV